MGFLIPKEQLDAAREKYYCELAEARAKQRAAEVDEYQKQLAKPTEPQTPESAEKKPFQYQPRSVEMWEARMQEHEKFGWKKPKKKKRS
jgi:hypothetical protein